MEIPKNISLYTFHYNYGNRVMVIKQGIRGNMLTIIRPLYNNVKCCIKYSIISDFFICKNYVI